MVASCAAYNCTQKHEKGISFHAFPKDENLRKKWIVAMKRDKWQPSKSSVLCQKHFRDDDYEISGWTSLKRLKKDAVPSVFEFPSHLKPKTVNRLPPKIRTLFTPKQSSKSSEIVTSEVEVVHDEVLPVPFANLENLPDCDHSKSLSTDDSHIETHPMEKRKKREHYVGDFSNSGNKALEKAQEVIMKKNKQLKLERQKVARLTKKITHLEDLVHHLKEKFSTPDVTVQNLLSSVPENCRTLFTQMLTGGQGRKYPPELKCFAITLDFYSPKAYEYVRSTFDKCLPNRRTIHKWYQNISCEPGFNTESLEALKLKVQRAKAVNRRVVCSLIFDEMSIRKQVDLCGDKVVGYVDLGGGNMGNDEAPMAKDALVFMLNCLNDNWKIPVGYFLINSITAEEKANLVKKCLDFLHESGVDVVSLTFDGLQSNLSMCKFLGADVSVEKLKPWFEHPNTKEKVFIFPDPPHMLKLVRNSFASLTAIYEKNGRVIKWDYLDKLVQIQNEEGLHLATKIRERHIKFLREKMRVKIAAQTLSRSVAKALEYLRLTNYAQLYFSGSQPTEEFITIMNNAFDILNSRNKFAYGFKGGLTEKNYSTIVAEIDRICDYIKNLKEPSEGLGLLIKGKKKVGFVGLIISLTALKGLFDEYILGKRKILSFLLSYKMSQDHVEVFFSAIRSRGGYNNNPSALQFKSAYKRLLLHTEVRGSKYGNCLDTSQMSPSILSLNSTHKKSVVAKALLPIEVSVLEAEENFLEQISREAPLLDHDYDIVSYPICSEYASDVINYMAGFVVRKLKKLIHCDRCLEVLEDRSVHPSFLQATKQSVKGLISASRDVTYLCQLSEKAFRLESVRGNLAKLDFDEVTIQVFRNVRRPVFQKIQDHQFEETPLANHVLHLVKMIIHTYLKVRVHHETRQVTEASKKERIRSALTKQILFSNQ